MDHRKITRLRHVANFARDNREKAVIDPDDLHTLLDYALAQIEEEN